MIAFAERSWNFHNRRKLRHFNFSNRTSVRLNSKIIQPQKKGAMRLLTMMMLPLTATMRLPTRPGLRHRPGLRLLLTLLRHRPCLLRHRPCLLRHRPRLRSVHLRLRSVHLRLRTINRPAGRSPRPIHHRAILSRPILSRPAHHRPANRRRSRPPMIQTRKSTPIPHRHLLMLHLHRRPLNPSLIHYRLLPRIRPVIHPTRSAIIAHTVHRDIIDHRPIDISIMDNRRIHTRHRRIIPEATTIPFPTIISRAAIPAAIIDTAVISHMRSPITHMPRINAPTPTPITRRPIQSNGGRRRPITRHPIIVTGILIPRPVTGYPKISFHRARWLYIHRNGRRRNSNRYTDTYLCIHLHCRQTNG